MIIASYSPINFKYIKNNFAQINLQKMSCMSKQNWNQSQNLIRLKVIRLGKWNSILAREIFQILSTLMAFKMASKWSDWLIGAITLCCLLKFVSDLMLLFCNFNFSWKFILKKFKEFLKKLKMLYLRITLDVLLLYDELGNHPTIVKSAFTS